MFCIALRLLKAVLTLFHKQMDVQITRDFTYRHPRLCTIHLIIILLHLDLNVSELMMAKVIKCQNNMYPKVHETSLEELKRRALNAWYS